MGRTQKITKCGMARSERSGVSGVSGTERDMSGATSGAASGEEELEALSHCCENHCSISISSDHHSSPSEDHSRDDHLCRDRFCEDDRCGCGWLTL